MHALTHARTNARKRTHTHTHTHAHAHSAVIWHRHLSNLACTLPLRQFAHPGVLWPPRVQAFLQKLMWFCSCCRQGMPVHMYMDMLGLQADGYDTHCGSLVVVYCWCSCTRETDGCGAKHAYWAGVGGAWWRARPRPGSTQGILVEIHSCVCLKLPRIASAACEMPHRARGLSPTCSTRRWCWRRQWSEGTDTRQGWCDFIMNRGTQPFAIPEVGVLKKLWSNRAFMAICVCLHTPQP